MVERRIPDPKAAGSSPVGVNFVGGVVQFLFDNASNSCRSYGVAVSTSDFESGYPGSNPGRTTFSGNFQNPAKSAFAGSRTRVACLEGRNLNR